jgi:hypothetical protein
MRDDRIRVFDNAIFVVPLAIDNPRPGRTLRYRIKGTVDLRIFHPKLGNVGTVARMMGQGLKIRKVPYDYDIPRLNVRKKTKHRGKGSRLLVRNVRVRNNKRVCGRH